MLKYSPLGAQVLHASIYGRSLFFRSPLSSANQHTVRGGVPVLFPQFAECGPLKKHGFARDLPWQLREERLLADSHCLVFELQIQQGDQPQWRHTAKLVLVVRLAENALHFDLQVHNKSNGPFAWTGGLHPYFGTADVLSSQLIGLRGARVQDRYNPSRITETDDAVRWTGDEFERLYDTQDSLRLLTPSHSVKLSMSGFDQWMVWNPGIAGALALKDLPNEDWQGFVCIEPVRVSRPSVLQPGEAFEGGLQIVVEPALSSFGSHSLG